MQAIVLAGGFGTRLKPVADGVPKPMVPVAGKPFLERLLDYMVDQGVTEIVLCVHYMHEKIRRHFGNRFKGASISYCIEKEPLGTGGAIRHGFAFLNPNQPIFVVNGDSLVHVDYRRMYAKHIERQRRITFAPYYVADCRRYSELILNGNSVARFELLGQAMPGAINTGLYVVSPDLFDGFGMPEKFSFESDFLKPFVPKLQPAVYEPVRYFIDIGVPGDYTRAEEEIPALETQELAQ